MPLAPRHTHGFASSRATLSSLPLPSGGASPGGGGRSGGRGILVEGLEGATVWALVGVWYLAGVVAVASTKTLLQGDESDLSPSDSSSLSSLSPPPLSFLTVSLFQFAFSSSSLNFSLTGSPFPPPSLPSLRLPPASRTALGLAAFFFAAGFLLTNAAFSVSSASFTEAIKASEPLTSSLAAIFYGVDVLPPPEAAGLLVTLTGAFLAATSTGKGSGDGGALAVALAVGANACFSLRGANQKKAALLAAGAARDPGASKDPAGILASSPASVLFRFSYFGLFLTLPLWLLHQILLFDSSPLTSSPSVRSPFLSKTLPLLLLNASTFTLYNLASTAVLTRLSPISHASLNCGRRIFAIAVTALYFQTTITGRGVAGVALTVAGIAVYEGGRES